MCHVALRFEEQRAFPLVRQRVPPSPAASVLVRAQLLPLAAVQYDETIAAAAAHIRTARRGLRVQIDCMRRPLERQTKPVRRGVRFVLEEAQLRA